MAIFSLTPRYHFVNPCFGLPISQTTDIMGETFAEFRIRLTVETIFKQQVKVQQKAIERDWLDARPCDATSELMWVTSVCGCHTYP